MSYIDINKLNFKYNQNKLFKDITFSVDKGSLTCITTPSSRGKTTLLNIISGNIKTDNVVSINNDNYDSMEILNNSFKFYCVSILEELQTVSNNIKLIKKYLKDVGLLKYINYPLFDLTYVQLQKINLIKAILNNKKIILIDNIFPYFDNYSKIEFIGYLKKYQFENNITFIYTTNNLQDSFFCDKIVIIDKEKIYDGKIENIYSDSKIIKKSKLNIPLEYELVEKLRLYDMIKNFTCTIEEMVDEICKLN